MTAETRSVYSGPIRRSLDRLDRARGGLTGELAALEARVAAAETEMAKLPRGVIGVGNALWSGDVVVANGWALTEQINAITYADRRYKATFNLHGWYGPGSLAFALYSDGAYTGHASWMVNNGASWGGGAAVWNLGNGSGLNQKFDARIVNYQATTSGNFVVAGSPDLYLMIEDIGPHP